MPWASSKLLFRSGQAKCPKRINTAFIPERRNAWHDVEQWAVAKETRKSFVFRPVFGNNEICHRVNVSLDRILLETETSSENGTAGYLT